MDVQYQQDHKYRQEIQAFTERFGTYQDARIVLYGIGRYTATLLEGVRGFRFVGLMDKDPANTGKRIAGVPVVDQQTAEETADLVIINTAEAYWEVIYRRIQDMKIPVYYINGERAGEREKKGRENPYREWSGPELLREAEQAEVVSFDFFDTLFQRSVCSPRDVFRLLEKQCEWGLPLTQMRDQAKQSVRENYSLDELYAQMAASGSLSQEQAGQLKKKELELERGLLIPRTPMLVCLRKLLGQGKEVYLVSDMYLPKEWYMDIFRKHGIEMPADAILLSNETDTNKADGSLWGLYASRIVKGRRALHIGDHPKADAEKPAESGIKTYPAPDAWNLLLASSLGDTAPRICSPYASAVMGCVLGRMFANPYVFSGRDATVRIGNGYEMGYCVFGPAILTFLLWLHRQRKEDGIKTLAFLSRDGYFLKEDYDYLCGLTGEEGACCYLGISRQLAMSASIETEEDLREYASMPYTGSVAELLEDRFGIHAAGEEEAGNLEGSIARHRTDIENHLADIRRNYRDYLKGFGLDASCAVVDIGYYGNNQKYLNKLLGIRMPGYYFNANLSGKNANAKSQTMKACFQRSGDETGEGSQVLKKQIYLESFLTAPYGMIKAVDEKNGFVCAPSKGNQEHFQEKEEINRGVKQLIADYAGRFGTFDLEPDRDFADRYYGDCFGGGVEFSDEVKGSFYNDNAMMHRMESGLFD